MARVASWTEVSDGLQQQSKRDAFDAISNIANEYFTHRAQRPARVEIELTGESVYDDEGGSFTSLTLTAFSVFDADGQPLEPRLIGSNAPLDAEQFLDNHLRERLQGLEWDISRHFHIGGDRCAVDLLEPPAIPEPFLTDEEVKL